MMTRQLQQAIFLPASKDVLYDLEALYSYQERKKKKKKLIKYFFKNAFGKFLNYLSVRFLRKPSSLKWNYVVFNNIWQNLYNLVQNNYIIILYPEREQEINEQELHKRFLLMKDNKAAHLLMSSNYISEFESIINEYDFNPFNSSILSNDPHFLNEICNYLSQRYGSKDIDSSYRNSYQFKIILNKDYTYKYINKHRISQVSGISNSLRSIDGVFNTNVYLPFLENKLIYVEEEYDHFANQAILENYEKLKALSLESGFEFVYFPKYNNHEILKTFVAEYLQYYYPYLGLKATNLQQIVAKNSELFNWNEFILERLNIPKLKHPILFFVANQNSIEFPQDLYYANINSDYKSNISGLFYNLRAITKGDNVLFQLAKKSQKNADDLFNIESELLASDVIEKIEHLKSQGKQALMAEIALKLIEKLDEQHLEKLGIRNKNKIIDAIVKPPVSRLCIEWKTKYDFDIVLPDYGNLVVEMPRLPKAIYYVFLQHPEGILFNELDKYRNELLVSYKRISNKSDLEEIEKNIERLMDPFDNSINVNCSRIKSAFVKLIDDRLAMNYYITGHRGEAKRIMLAPDLIEIIELR